MFNPIQNPSKKDKQGVRTLASRSKAEEEKKTIIPKAKSEDAGRQTGVKIKSPVSGFPKKKTAK